VANNLNFTFTGKDKTQQAFQSLNRNLSKVQKGFDKLKGSIVPLIGTVGIGAMTKSIMASTDALGKASVRLGVASERLQTLRFAAEQSGLQVSTFDMALQRFTRRTAEASNGTGEAKDALKQLGIQLKDGSGNLRSNTDLLMDVADALQKVESPSERVRIAFKLFDSEGVKMVNMLKDGSVNIKELERQFREAGGTISNKFTDNVQDVNDKLNVLSKVLTGNLSKSLSGVVAQFAESETSLGFIKTLSVGIGRVLNYMLMGFQVLGTEIKFIINQLSVGMVGSFDVLKKEFALFIESINFVSGDTKKAQEELLEAERDLSMAVAKGMNERNRSLDKIKKGYEEGVKALDEEAGLIKESNTELNKKDQIIKKIVKPVGRLKDLEEDTLDIYEKEAEEYGELLAQKKQNFRITKESNDLFGKQLDEQMKKQGSTTKSLGQALFGNSKELQRFVGHSKHAHMIFDNIHITVDKISGAFTGIKFDLKGFALDFLMKTKLVQKGAEMVFGFIDNAVDSLIPGLEDSADEANRLAEIAKEIDAEIQSMTTSIDDFALDIMHANDEMKALAEIEKTYQERVKKANELDAEHLKYYAQIEKDLGILAYRVGVLRSATQAFASSAQQFLDAVATEGFTDIQKRFFAMVTGFERGTQKAFGDIIEQADAIIAETPLNPEKMVEAFKELQTSMQRRVAGDFGAGFQSLESILDKFGITKEDTPIAGLLNEMQEFIAKGGAGTHTAEVLRRMTIKYLGVIESGITAMDAKIAGYNEAVKAKAEAEAKMPEALKGLVIMLKDVMETEFQSGATKEQLKLDVDALEETFKGLGIGIEELKTFIDSLVKIEQPSGAMGGLVKKYPYGGKIYGPSHGAGGVNANLEGGEFVMSRSAVKKYGSQFMSSVNNGSMGSNVVVNIYDGTGQKISEFESGLRVEINQRANRYNEFPALSY